MNKRLCLLLVVALLVRLAAGGAHVNGQQPSWNATGALGVSRVSHTATPLVNGKVLVVGGLSAFPNFGDAELYDPGTGQWSVTGKPLGQRVFHTAVRLANGRVLVIGGIGDPFSIIFGAEIYDPDTGKWSAAGNLNFPRVNMTAVLLADGRVLVTGGLALFSEEITNTAEVYDPITNQWSFTGAMNAARVLHSATLLPNGAVLVAGGYEDNVLGTAEIYDPATGTWTPTGELTTPRANHPAVLLANGRVLVAGGSDGESSITDNAELFDSATGRWSRTGALTTVRYLHTLTLLPNGNVLAAGGEDRSLSTLRSAELYDPNAGSWRLTAALGVARFGHTATLLPNGKVLVAGGLEQLDESIPFTPLYSAELYDSGAPTVANVSAASFSAGPLAPESIAAAFGTNLASDTQTASALPLPTQLAGVSVRVRDRIGAERAAPLFFASPDQINYQIPPGAATGLATVNVSGGAAGVVEIASVAPGLFSANANGQGVVAGVILRVKADAARSFEPAAQFDAGQNRFVPAPIDVGNPAEQVFLLLFGTGFRHRSDLSRVEVRIGNSPAEALFAGAQDGFVGLDQCNVRLSPNLAGAGEVILTLSADGKLSNEVTIRIK